MTRLKIPNPFRLASRSESRKKNDHVAKKEEQTDVTNRRVKRNKRKGGFLILSALSMFLFYMNDLHYDSSLRRMLSCSKKRVKTNHERGENFFTDITDRLLVTVAEEDCETAYPADVAETTGTEYYAYPPFDSGLYYQEDAIIPTSVADDVVYEEIDPALIVPDVDEPVYYSEVDTALLDVYEPKTYEPVEETEIPPTDTTAYTITITSCPNDLYSPPDSEVTNPEGDIFEASAMIKQSICNATDSTSTTTRRNLRQLRRLQEAGGVDTTTSSSDYTM